METCTETGGKKPFCFPRNVNLENALEIISILGADKIKKVYNITAWQPVSFAALVKIIKFEEVDRALDQSESLNHIAREMHISKKTIYRLYKKKLQNRTKSTSNSL